MYLLFPDVWYQIIDEASPQNVESVVDSSVTEP